MEPKNSTFAKFCFFSCQFCNKYTRRSALQKHPAVSVR